ncbi:hypothetical protein [Terriglobus aquaticus]|uniref:Uncharacterized protein n=1 Tax=Terriglobus aquaticus TaxID=940139 RepID=A0ABW9KNV2_9BACT|nr:hypothetical protein [Terriglobus aquaticus]
MYEQAVIPVGNPEAFQTVRQAIESSFSSGRVAGFLSALQSSKLRIREFEQVLKAGKLGPAAADDYAKLGDGDQGMIRELYLSLLEQVDPELRRKFLKVYAYY